MLKPFMRFKKRGLVMLLFVILVLSFSNCEKNISTPAPVQLPGVVSFNNDVQPIFYLYCAMSGCHANTDAAGRINLSSDSAYHELFSRKLVDTINPTNSRLYTSLTRPMPPWGALIPYDRGLILKWIQQGAKNN